MAAKVSSVALIATTAATLFAAPALVAKVEVGDEVGNLKFYPKTIIVAAGVVGETGQNINFFFLHPAGASGSVLASELKATSMDENS